MTDYEYEHTDLDGDTLLVMASAGDPDGALVRVGTQNGRSCTFVPADKVEEVCAALREAAGLTPVWTVEKTSLDDDYDVSLREDGDVRDQGAVKLTPTAARLHAAQLLAAADEAEARASRPKLPTADGAHIRVGGKSWVREGGLWYRPGFWGSEHDEYLASQDFAVLYDPEKAS